MRKDVKEKSIYVALGYNFVFMGAGYWYAGRKPIGVLLMIITAIAFVSAFDNAGLFVIIPPLYFGFWITTAIDLSVYLKKVKMDSFVSCPRCAEKVKKQATYCIHCKSDIPAT